MDEKDWRYEMLGAQRDLIRECGKIDRAAKLCKLSPAQMGRYNEYPADEEEEPTIMPMRLVWILERECRRPFVTAVMARQTGRLLAEPCAPEMNATSVLSSKMELDIAVAEVNLEFARDVADGHLSRSELRNYDRKLAKVQAEVADARADVAGAMAGGGTKVDLKIVTGD
ncbi:MAG: hypothetical protein JWM58_561 [Rhizobium sp.]|nr:hypothetical protein [Rhizobium sp.]